MIKQSRGMGLVEIVLYVGLLGAVMALVANFLIQIASTYQRARAEREVISNARLLQETVTKTIAQAQGVYAPTSRFQTNAGQLSIITPVGAQPEHTTAYVDFWVDGGRLWMRSEGSAAIPLSASTVRVNTFYLEWILQGLNRQSVKMKLSVDSTNSRFPFSLTLNSATALRGSY